MKKLSIITKEDLVALAVEAATIALSKMDEKKSSHIKTKESPTLIRGIQGLANFLGVSQPTAQRLKNAKLFPCYQNGRTIIFKADEVLLGLANNNVEQETTTSEEPCVCAIAPDSLHQYVISKSEQILNEQDFNVEHLKNIIWKSFLFGLSVSHYTESELKIKQNELHPFNDYIK